MFRPPLAANRWGIFFTGECFGKSRCFDFRLPPSAQHDSKAVTPSEAQRNRGVSRVGQPETHAKSKSERPEQSKTNGAV